MSIEKINSFPVQTRRFDGGRVKQRAQESAVTRESERVDRATLRSVVATDTRTLSGSPLRDVAGVRISAQMASSLSSYVGAQISELGPEALGAHGTMDPSRVAALLN